MPPPTSKRHASHSNVTQPLSRNGSLPCAHEPSDRTQQPSSGPMATRVQSHLERFQNNFLPLDPVRPRHPDQRPGFRPSTPCLPVARVTNRTLAPWYERPIHQGPEPPPHCANLGLGFGPITDGPNHLSPQSSEPFLFSFFTSNFHPCFHVPTPKCSTHLCICVSIF